MVIAKRQFASNRPTARDDIAEEPPWFRSAGDRNRRAGRPIDASAIRQPRGLQPSAGSPHRSAAGHGIGRCVVYGHDRIGDRCRVEWLAKASRRKRARILHILAGDQEDVSIPVQRKVLKPVVEHMDGAAEVMLRKPPRKIAAAGCEHRDAVEAPREHQRLVSCAVQIRADALWVADDDHTILNIAPRVSAAQDRGAFAQLAKTRGDQRRPGRFRTAGDRGGPNADYRPVRAPLQVWTPEVIGAADARRRGVERRDQWTTRKARTLPGPWG